MVLMSTVSPIIVVTGTSPLSLLISNEVYERIRPSNSKKWSQSLLGLLDLVIFLPAPHFSSQIIPLQHSIGDGAVPFVSSLTLLPKFLLEIAKDLFLLSVNNHLIRHVSLLKDQVQGFMCVAFIFHRVGSCPTKISRKNLRIFVSLFDTVPEINLSAKTLQGNCLY